MKQIYIFDQKNNAKKNIFADLPTLFFSRPLQETKYIFFLALSVSGCFVVIDTTSQDVIYLCSHHRDPDCVITLTFMLD